MILLVMFPSSDEFVVRIASLEVSKELLLHQILQAKHFEWANWRLPEGQDCDMSTTGTKAELQQQKSKVRAPHVRDRVKIIALAFVFYRLFECRWHFSLACSFIPRASRVCQRFIAHFISTCWRNNREFSAKDLRHVGNYTLGKLIGKGSFGKVYLAKHNLTNGSKVKIVNNTARRMDMTLGIGGSQIFTTRRRKFSSRDSPS